MTLYHRCPVCMRKKVNLRTTKLTKPTYRCSSCGWYVPETPRTPIDTKRLEDLSKANSRTSHL